MRTIVARNPQEAIHYVLGIRNGCERRLAKKVRLRVERRESATAGLRQATGVAMGVRLERSRITTIIVSAPLLTYVERMRRSGSVRRDDVRYDRRQGLSGQREQE